MVRAEEKGLIPEIFAKKDATKFISREEFCALAVKLYETLTGKKVEVCEDNPFTDTNDAYVLKAYKLGITKGVSETEFGNGLITREQMATMETRVLTLAGIDTSIDLSQVVKFVDDINLNEWGKTSVYFMAKEGIIKGVAGNKFNGLENAKIEEAIVVALRSVEVFGK